MFQKQTLAGVITLRDGRSYEVEIADDGQPPLVDDKVYLFKTAANGNDLAVRGADILCVQIVGESGQVDNPVE